MKKRCVIGKSCGATCIHRVKVCRVELAAALSSSVAQARDTLLTKQPEKAAPEQKSATNGAGPEKSTPTNPWGLNKAQEETWSTLLGKIRNIDHQDAMDRAAGRYNPAQTKAERKSAAILEKVNQLADEYGALPYLPNRDNPSSRAGRLLSVLGMKKLMSAVNAVRGFTGEDYSFIRAAQRGEVGRSLREAYGYKPGSEKHKAEVERWKKKADEIETFLRYQPKPIIPKFRGVGVSDERLDELKKLAQNKGVIKELSMNSWTTDPPTARFFSNSSTEANKVIYRTVNRKGAAIRGISQEHDEQEILTPANSRYQVFDVQGVLGRNGKTLYHVVDLVEF